MSTSFGIDGDILILGAAGKMGPSLARLCRRAADAAGNARRIFAVSRRPVCEPGIESIVCDLLDRAQSRACLFAPMCSTSPAANSDPRTTPSSPGR